MGEQKNFEGIKILADNGLNLFACLPILKLPREILDLLEEEGIPYEKDHVLCVIGNGGPALWNKLPHPLNEADHPIDQFSIQKMQEFAKNILGDEINILFPHPKWNIPLQRIGRALNISRPSLLGMDINRQYGVWFAFRGVFLTKKKIPSIVFDHFTSPCDDCADRTCLSACPARAVDEKKKFDISACAEFRLTGPSPCEDRCLARIACSYKKEQQYPMDQIKYHMTRAQHLKKLNSFIKKRL